MPLIVGIVLVLVQVAEVLILVASVLVLVGEVLVLVLVLEATVLETSLVIILMLVQYTTVYCIPLYYCTIMRQSAPSLYTTLCLKKFRTTAIFSNNTNKSGPILITFARENRQ